MSEETKPRESHATHEHRSQEEAGPSSGRGQDSAPEEELGRLLSLIVHDLRNPAATIGANLSFLEDVGLGSTDEEVPEVFSDLRDAVAELSRGLDQLGWIARWLAGAMPVSVIDGDAGEACRMAARSVPNMDLRVEVGESASLRAAGGGTLCRVLGLLLENARQHAPGKPVRLRARREGEEVVVEVRDGGQPVADDVGQTVFTVSGQTDLKGRPDGRYGRAAGLLAVRVLAESMGARISACNDGGEATFQIRLRAL